LELSVSSVLSWEKRLLEETPLAISLLCNSFPSLQLVKMTGIFLNSYRGLRYKVHYHWPWRRQESIVEDWSNG
jgi:hypothetical protein